MRVRIITSRLAPQSVRDLLSRTVRAHGPAVQVQRRQVPYWHERGWTRNGNAYTGTYQTRYASFYGEIADHGGGDIEFFFYQPSEQIRQHSHWACFQDRGNGWYLVHMGRSPKDVSSGILALERLITEAFER